MDCSLSCFSSKISSFVLITVDLGMIKAWTRLAEYDIDSTVLGYSLFYYTDMKVNFSQRKKSFSLSTFHYVSTFCVNHPRSSWILPWETDLIFEMADLRIFDSWAQVILPHGNVAIGLTCFHLQRFEY